MFPCLPDACDNNVDPQADQRRSADLVPRMAGRVGSFGRGAGSPGAARPAFTASRVPSRLAGLVRGPAADDGDVRTAPPPRRGGGRLPRTDHGTGPARPAHWRSPGDVA